MVDAESQQIRDEVIRALAQQSEHPEVDGLPTRDAIDANGVPVAMPAWDGVAEKPAAIESASNDARIADEELSAEEVEHLFLAAVFDNVRVQSKAGKLSSPSAWLEAGLVPEHFEADDWEMFVYEYLEERAAERAEAEADSESEPGASVRTATCAVGVPRRLRVRASQEKSEPEFASYEESGSGVDAECESALGLGAGGDDDAGSVAQPADADRLACDDIVVLVGKHSYYLYSKAFMTDAYARWAFLASEDDRVLTFVECVRDESRKYPRPMEASSLLNPPFKMTFEEVEELWRAVRDSGAYPDLNTLTASNGDVYYFSTDYLTPTYAASLAEWNSVERDMFL